jgi:hypothetical protein
LNRLVLICKNRSSYVTGALGITVGFAWPVVSLLRSTYRTRPRLFRDARDWLRG